MEACQTPNNKIKSKTGQFNAGKKNPAKLTLQNIKLYACYVYMILSLYTYFE